jgi:inner membrane protein involved in colicin E2 resistance
MPEVPSVAPPPLPKSQPFFARRHSTLLKLLGVGALVLVLLIPLAMITGVLNERLQRRNEAVADITSSWGREQNVIGPVLGIPYQYKFKTVKEIPAPDGKVERREVEETATANAYFLPETLNISGSVQTQKLHRGIYEAVVYRAQTVLSGKFATPDFGPLKIDLKDVQWKDAFVTIAINDLRGAREAIVLDWGGVKHPMLPGSQVPGYTTGATASLGSDQPMGTEVQFSIPLDFNGSEGIFFAPFGVQNEATLKSNWPDPGFRGAFLPADGAALCLFYLLLLSISEFVGFGWAYLIAASASTLLITWYCRFFLGGGVRTFMIGAGLAGVYLFLYITLRQQDYALLMGAVALFIVLAIVMYVTRKVDWYARDAGNL